MKLSIQLLGICCLIALQACRQNDEKSQLLTRKWRVTFTAEQLLNTMSPSEREFYKMIPEEIRKKELQSVIATANSNTFEFKADKTFEMTLKGQETHESGTWSLEKTPENLKLILIKKTVENNGIVGKDELIIKELTRDKLVILIDSSKKEIFLEPMQQDKI